MLNFKKIDYIVISVFMLLEIALYLSFLFIDKGIFVTRIESSTLKYAGISLCLAFSLYCLIRKRKMVISVMVKYRKKVLVHFRLLTKEVYCDFQKTVFFLSYKNDILTNERRHSDLKMTLSLSFF